MRKKETQITDITNIVKERGFRIDYFLKRIGISATHFHFVRKGERTLGKDKKDAINEMLGTNLK